MLASCVNCKDATPNRIQPQTPTPPDLLQAMAVPSRSVAGTARRTARHVGRERLADRDRPAALHPGLSGGAGVGAANRSGVAVDARSARSRGDLVDLGKRQAGRKEEN